MRNGAIDVYKFGFSWIIVLLHFYEMTGEHFQHGALGVEFFVLVSGVYFFMAWEKTKNQRNGQDLSFYPYEFAKKRFLRFFPYTTTAFVGTFITAVFFLGWFEGKTPFEIAAKCADYIWEILLIGRNGLVASGFLNGPVWTVSAMLLAEFFILCLLVRWEKTFCSFLCPISILVISGYWVHCESALYTKWIGFTTFGVLRVFVLTCLAYYCYCAVQWLKGLDFTKNGMRFLTICEAACFLLLFLIILNPDNRPLRFAGILLLCIGCSITISGKSFSTSLLADARWTRYLGELSFAIYLTHRTIVRVYSFHFPDPYEMYSHKYSFVLTVTVISALFLPLVKALSTASRLLFKWLRPKLIRTGTAEAPEK